MHQILIMRFKCAGGYFSTPTAVVQSVDSYVFYKAGIGCVLVSGTYKYHKRYIDFGCFQVHISSQNHEVLEDSQEGAPAEVWAEQAGEPEEARAQKKKVASESYEKRQMLWYGMTGRSWSELVQQWSWSELVRTYRTGLRGKQWRREWVTHR